MNSSSPSMPFSVDVYSDFRLGNSSPWLRIGEFDNLKDAIEACKKVVDEHLLSAIKKYSSSEHLVASFLNYGDVPTINGIENLPTFDVYEYLSQRCIELCNANNEPSLPDQLNLRALNYIPPDVTRIHQKFDIDHFLILLESQNGFMFINSYLNFLSASSKLWAGMSANERSILESLFERGDDPCRVQDVIAMRHIASQATLHKELKGLVAKGYVSLKTSPSDGRVKFVTLTKKSNQLADQLSKLLSKASKSS